VFDTLILVRLMTVLSGSLFYFLPIPYNRERRFAHNLHQTGSNVVHCPQLSFSMAKVFLSGAILGSPHLIDYINDPTADPRPKITPTGDFFINFNG
jgi:hypothetical protein